MKTDNDLNLKAKGFYYVRTNVSRYDYDLLLTNGVDFYKPRKNQYGHCYQLGDAVVMDQVPAPSDWVKN